MRCWGWKCFTQDINIVHTESQCRGAGFLPILPPAPPPKTGLWSRLGHFLEFMKLFGNPQGQQGLCPAAGQLPTLGVAPPHSLLMTLYPVCPPHKPVIRYTKVGFSVTITSALLKAPSESKTFSAGQQTCTYPRLYKCLKNRPDQTIP